MVENIKADVDVRKIFENAMINLVIDFPVYANLVTRIGCKIVDKPSMPAAAWTDGRNIYINEHVIREFNQNPVIVGNDGKEYHRQVTQKEMQFIICHELMHLIGLTFERDRNVGLTKADLSDESIRKFQLWNQATDYEINSLLHNNESTDINFGDRKRNPVGNMPDWVLYESKYRDMQAEEIFRQLVEEEKQENNGKLKSPEGIGADFTSGNGKGGLTPLDIHLPIQDQDIRNEVISKMSEVFGSKTNGTGESAIDRTVDNVYKAQPFNWRKALAKYMRKFVKENYTWSKPSRAGIANNIILPSNGTAPKLNIGVAIDTSGSISDKEINAMMDHLFTILHQFKAFEIDVWCCGSVVYKDTLMKITNENKRNLTNFQIKSDGGNDMRKNFSFIKDYYKGKDKIDLLIIMSDFYDPLDGDTETTSICPVIYMCLDHKDFKKPTLIKGEVYPFEIDGNK